MHTPKQRRKLAAKAESRVAQDLGGKKVFNSGAGFVKGDVRVPGKFRVEVKQTSKESYTLKTQDWVDICASAIKAGETPLLVVERAYPHPIIVVVTADYAYVRLQLRPVLVFTSTNVRSFSITPKRWKDANWQHLRLGLRVSSKLIPNDMYDVVVLDYARFQDMWKETS